MAGHAQKYIPLPSLPEDMESPMLAGAEEYQWEAVSNLDLFFTRLYRYWAGKGLSTQVLSGALNLAALGFTVAFSGFLLLGVNWHALLTAPCIAQDTCDIASVALVKNPLKSRGVFADILLLTYLVIFGAYWAWSALHYLTDIRHMMEMRHWVCNKLGVSDRGITLMTWAEVLHKVVRLQATSRLCMARDLNEHDVVNRIMRKDNYMIAFVNKGVLRLTPPPLGLVLHRAGCALARAGARTAACCLHLAGKLCSCFHSDSLLAASDVLASTSMHLYAWADGNHQRVRGRWAQGAGRGHRTHSSSLLAGRRALMTKTLEWNIRWCVLDHMFDEKFCIKREFLEQPERLKQRLRRAAVLNAVLSPFLLLFLFLYFFLRNAERFYHHPGSAGSRRWTALARWHLREFNELPHYIAHRLDAAHAPACHYLAQFPSHTIASIARFAAFVAGSFTALFLLLTMLDERLLERPLLGRQLVWWLASLGVVLTASRSFISDTPVAYDPEAAMQQVVVHTHYLPRNWRGRAHTAEVQAAFNQLFQFKVLLFLEELASVVLTPFMLYFTLPQCADNVVRFVSDFTVHVEGVGDVCSLACFDLQAHGNPKYGAPCQPGGPVRKAARSRQGKLEKSLLTFMATYPTWEPGPAGKAMLMSLYQQQQYLMPYPLAPGPYTAAAAGPAACWAAGNNPTASVSEYQSSVATLNGSHATALGQQRQPVDTAGDHAIQYNNAAKTELHHQQESELQQQGNAQVQAQVTKHPQVVEAVAGPLTVSVDQFRFDLGDLTELHAASGPDQSSSQAAWQPHQGGSTTVQQPIKAGVVDVNTNGDARHLGHTSGASQANGSAAGHTVLDVLPDSAPQGGAVSSCTGTATATEVQGAGAGEEGGVVASEGEGEGAAGGIGSWAPLASSLQCSVFGVGPLPGMPIDTPAVQASYVDVGEGTTSALLLPPNETAELSRRLMAGHSVLQGLYEQCDVSVQHRRMARYGSAAAGSMSGMSSSSMWGGGWGYQQALHPASVHAVASMMASSSGQWASQHHSSHIGPTGSIAAGLHTPACTGPTGSSAVGLQGLHTGPLHAPPCAGPAGSAAAGQQGPYLHASQGVGLRDAGHAVWHPGAPAAMSTFGFGQHMVGTTALHRTNHMGQQQQPQQQQLQQQHMHAGMLHHHQHASLSGAGHASYGVGSSMIGPSDPWDL